MKDAHGHGSDARSGGLVASHRMRSIEHAAHQNGVIGVGREGPITRFLKNTSGKGTPELGLSMMEPEHYETLMRFAHFLGVMATLAVIDGVVHWLGWFGSGT